MSRQIGIVGGGITGLSLAHYLDQQNIDFTLFEAASEPGGVIRSERVDGSLVEWGPQRARRTDHMDGLIRDLGLESEVREADSDLSICVYADGDLHEAPFTPEQFMETELLSWRGKLAVLNEPTTDPGKPDETAAKLFTRKFGKEAYENLLGPLFGGIYGSNPTNMPAGHALSGLLKLEQRDGSLLKAAIKRTVGGRATPPAISFDEGLQRLPEALAEAHQERVRFDAPVIGVRESGDKYEVETPDRTDEFDQVVLTTPADLSADLVAELSPDSADALRELNYNPLVLAYVRADLESGDVDPEALGYQVGYGEELRTLGVSWNASMFERDVCTCFFGGMHDPEIFEESDERIGEIATAEFEDVTGAEAEVVTVNRLRRGFPAYDTSWDAVERIDLPDGVRLATNYTARMGVPSRLREAERLATELAEN